MADAPVTPDFLADVAEEATYQLEHWGEAHDADKDDSFWFWTLGHIVGKAVHDDQQTVEKQRHRLRAGAALLLNWDRQIAARHGLDSDAPGWVQRMADAEGWHPLDHCGGCAENGCEPTDV